MAIGKIQSIAAHQAKYLSENARLISQADFPLAVLDAKKLEGMQAGINVFEGVSMPEIKFMTKFLEALNLVRGCKNRCGHCLRNAQLPLRQDGNTINTILWDDFLSFTTGVRELSERLGASIFKGNPPIALFDDANGIELKSFDLNAKPHNLAEAVRLFFEKIKHPMSIVNAGWDKNDAHSQKAAQELVEFLQKTPEASAEFALSVNPFHGLLLDSLKAAQEGKPEAAKELRQRYVDNMANAFYTCLPMYENSAKGSIIYRYACNLAKNENFKQEDAAKLYAEIYERLQQLAGSKLENYPALNPETVTLHNPKTQLIEAKGRGMQYFLGLQKGIKEQELADARNIYEELPVEQRARHAFDCTLKEVDINGQIYAINPDETNIPTGIRLNFVNKNRATAPLHSDIKYPNLVEI